MPFRQKGGRIVLWLFALLAVPGAAVGADLSVTAASWRPDLLILLIEGTAHPPDSVVLVRDADTRALIGSAAVRADGKWMLKIRRPPRVPSRTRVELGATSTEIVVDGPKANQ